MAPHLNICAGKKIKSSHRRVGKLRLTAQYWLAIRSPPVLSQGPKICMCSMRLHIENPRTTMGGYFRRTAEKTSRQCSCAPLDHVGMPSTPPLSLPWRPSTTDQHNPSRTIYRKSSANPSLNADSSTLPTGTSTWLGALCGIQKPGIAPFWLMPGMRRLAPAPTLTAMLPVAAKLPVPRFPSVLPELVVRIDAGRSEAWRGTSRGGLRWTAVGSKPPSASVAASAWACAFGTSGAVCGGGASSSVANGGRRDGVTACDALTDLRSPVDRVCAVPHLLRTQPPSLPATPTPAV